ncbi:DUF3667 domain-containing protein [Jiulongibacter sp. NS-SX5]|uniref:DUF3667 domain-containing protein n=1 Tax=Jiulongibacter sp. NS-SX5 TaxID=3463854 RepID=UPI004059BCFF
MKCKNCEFEVNGKYCSNCGTPAQLKRIDGHYIVHEIEHVLHLDKGIFFTLKELLIRPGKSVREFILERRNRLVKPIIFIILTSLVYTILNNLTHFEDGYLNYQDLPDGTFKNMLNWVQGHYGYANIIMGVFIAFWLKLFFKKYGFNVFEIVILLCYVMGVGMIVIGIFGALDSIGSFPFGQVGGYIFFLYCVWAIGEFFERKPVNYFKAFVAYVIGYLSFFIVVFLVSYLVDLIIK